METRYCPDCKNNKPSTDFHKRGPNGFQSRCKICKSEVDRQYNLASDKKRLRKKERDRQLKEWVNAQKAERGCAYCSERESLFLDFHHREGKEFCIAEIKRRSKKVIEAEIKKCDVVCCKCHRMIHAGWDGPWNQPLPSPSKRRQRF